MKEHISNFRFSNKFTNVCIGIALGMVGYNYIHNQQLIPQVRAQRVIIKTNLGNASGGLMGSRVITTSHIFKPSILQKLLRAGIVQKTKGKTLQFTMNNTIQCVNEYMIFIPTRNIHQLRVTYGIDIKIPNNATNNSYPINLKPLKAIKKNGGSVVFYKQNGSLVDISNVVRGDSGSMALSRNKYGGDIKKVGVVVGANNTVVLLYSLQNGFELYDKKTLSQQQLQVCN